MSSAECQETLTELYRRAFEATLTTEGSTMKSTAEYQDTMTELYTRANEAAFARLAPATETQASPHRRLLTRNGITVRPEGEVVQITFRHNEGAHYFTTTRAFCGRVVDAIARALQHRAAGATRRQIADAAHAAAMEAHTHCVSAAIRSRAIQMLTAAQGGYLESRHARRVDRLAEVLRDHPDARVAVCQDERTGERFGRASCRRGRCAKLGHTTWDRQFWAVWD